MSRFAVTCFLLLFTIITVVQSSAEGGADDIDQLFTSNVEIVDYSFSPAPDAVTYDNDARLLLIGDRSYSYPDEIESIIVTHLSVEDRIVITVRETVPVTDSNTNNWREWVWYFDTAAETFTRLINRCDDRTHLRYSDIDARWIYVEDSDTGQVRICELATGITSEPLPSQFSWEVPPPLSSASVPVFTSSDGQWLLLFGEQSDQTYVFSYNTTSETLVELGVIPCDYCVEREAVKWFGSLATVWSWESVTGEHAIYSVDVTRTNSLELQITRPRYIPEFYDNPPRYDYVNFTTPENIWDTQCERVIYDVLSGETKVTDMGSVCRPEQGSLDGIGYYRDVSRGADGIAALTRFNAETGESKILYEGEIELIEWVSPDERYAALVLGKNERIDILPFLSPDHAWGLPESPKLALVDLVNDTVVLETWTGWRWCDAPFGGPDWSWSEFISETSVEWCGNIGPTGAILPRTDGSFLVIGTIEAQDNHISTDSTAFADIASVQDGTVTRTRVTEGNLIPFSVDYILNRTWDSTQRTRNYSLTPVDGESAIQITNDIQVDDFQRAWLVDVYPSTNQMRFYFSPEPELGRDWYSAYVTVQVIAP